MVLKDSKWDRKAKSQYLRKHGLNKSKEEAVIRPKWSSKKEVAKKVPLLEDSDDSDDEFLKLHYPQLGEELTNEQKEKVKKQILVDLQNEVNDISDHEPTENNSEHGRGGEAIDGIYLGSDEAKQQFMEKNSETSRLDEFISHDMAGADVSVIPKKNRKLLKNKLSEDLLLEYGLEDYKQIVNNDQDYSKPFMEKQLQRNIDRISDEDLIGFEIGQDSIASRKSHNTKNNVTELTDEEKKEMHERLIASEQARLHRQMKEKFGKTANKAPTLEINNINENDPQQMQMLNSRLTHLGNDEGNVDDELDLLLGENSKSKSETDKTKIAGSTDIDDFLSSLTVNDSKTGKTSSVVPKKRVYKPSQSDDKFLDELLG